METRQENERDKVTLDPLLYKEAPTDESVLDSSVPRRKSQIRSKRFDYLKKLLLVQQLLLAIFDQVYDFYLISLLIGYKKYAYAACFTLVDLLPAMFIMWQKLRENVNWRVLLYSCHPINVIFWTLMTIFNEKHDFLLKDIRAAHVAIEAPFQIMLTATLISLGVLKLPGTEQNSFKNAYGFEIDFQWWPVATTILSFLGILFGTLWMFSPIVKETGKVVGYLTFIPIFLFRLFGWLLIILMLERFSLFIFAGAVLINAFVLFMIQKDQMSLDPVNYSLLSLVFPTFKLPSNQLDHSVSLKILTTLVTTTNLLLMMSLSIIYGLYQTDKYNPWCNEDLSELLFQEEIFQRSFWFFVALFLTATLPTIFVYLTKILRVKVGKVPLLAILTSVLTAASVIVLAYQLKGIQLSSVYKSKIVNSIRLIKGAEHFPGSNNPKWSKEWSNWVELSISKGQERYRQCMGQTLRQRWSNSTEDQDIQVIKFPDNGTPWRQGTLKYRDGSTYTGEFLDGLKHGEGKEILYDDSELGSSTYTGDFIEDERHGQGIMTWQSGEIYNGTWKNGLKEGLGQDIFPNGDSYVGEFKNDTRSGNGTFIWASGNKYVGSFLDNDFNGQGVLYYGKNETDFDRYEGSFSEDQFNGQGTLHWKDMSRLEGTFVNGLADGFGIKYGPDGKVVYKGQWKEGEPVVDQ